jgi:hypothetical protein
MGQVGDLIQRFQGRETLPIDVNDVLAAMWSNGLDIEVEFIGVELDITILRGKYRLFDWPNGFYGGDPHRMANIYYHVKDERDWQRFVCCKEITHLLDNPAFYTGSREDQVALAEKVGLPPHLQDPLSAPIEVNLDFIAESVATALLFPMASRNKFVSALTDKKLRTSDIALIADIPVQYVEIAMRPFWTGIHEKLLHL